MLEPETVRLLRLHVPAGALVDWREIDPADMSAYWRILREAWTRPGSLVVVEHDIGIGAEVIPGFASCPRPFCAHAYPLDGGVVLACLGCTRFTAGLKAAEPDLLDVVGEVTGDGLPAKDWRRLDVRILDELRKRGYERHQHEPDVRHYHRYGQDGRTS